MKNNNDIGRWENEGGEILNNEPTLNEQLATREKVVAAETVMKAQQDTIKLQGTLLAAEQKKVRSLTHCLKGIHLALTHAGDGGFFKRTIALIDDCLTRNK